MEYKFPRIEHIDDVRPAIEGRDEFVVAQRDWGYVINYMVNMSDTFPPVNDQLDAIRRECRGMLFYPNGKIMSRRLHKFFNVNERDETQHHLIDLSKPHVILEKLDGSMITPVVLDWVPDGPRYFRSALEDVLRDEQPQLLRVGEMRWGTKMGITDVAAGAEEFVKAHPNYDKFARWAIELGYTPIFEWCSRKQRIVVDYPEDRLVLIAVRATVSGEYQSLEWMRQYAAKWNVEVVKAYEGTTHNMEQLIAHARGQENQEGYILRFDDGHMVKIKGDWYVRIHKAKDNLALEKNVVDMIVNEKVDDAKAFMLDEDRHRVDKFETAFWNGIAESTRRYDHSYQLVLANGLDRKRYAQEWMPTVKAYDTFAPQYIFGRFDGKDGRQMIVDYIRKNTGTQTKINSVRNLWGGHCWDYHFESDN